MSEPTSLYPRTSMSLAAWGLAFILQYMGRDGYVRRDDLLAALPDPSKALDRALDELRAGGMLDDSVTDNQSAYRVRGMGGSR